MIYPRQAPAPYKRINAIAVEWSCPDCGDINRSRSVKGKKLLLVCRCGEKAQFRFSVWSPKRGRHS